MVIKLDCRNKQFNYYPLNMKDHLIVLVNTGVQHDLAMDAGAEYNKRR